jgi:hypothetical protein
LSASMFFHGDSSTWVRLHDYGTDHPPILALDGEGHGLTVSVFEGHPVADHKAFAEQLVRTVAAYATAVDRWAAAQSDAPATAQGE